MWLPIRSVDFTRQDAAESLDDDALSTVDVLDEDEERLIEASASRIMPRRASSPTPARNATEAEAEDDDDDDNFSAQATPLARTPLRRSLDMTALTNLNANCC